MDSAATEAILDRALLTDEECALGPAGWGCMKDPFMLWERGSPSERARALGKLSSDALQQFKALEEIQKPATELAIALAKERELLALKYLTLQQALWKKRAEILLPLPIPTSSKVASTSIPDFWLRAMLNHEVVAESIKARDKPVLSCLVDIQWEFLPELKVRLMVER